MKIGFGFQTPRRTVAESIIDARLEIIIRNPGAEWPGELLEVVNQSFSGSYPARTSLSEFSNSFQMTPVQGPLTLRESIGGFRSMTAKMAAAAALAEAKASTYGAAWPTFMAPISTEKKT